MKCTPLLVALLLLTYINMPALAMPVPNPGTVEAPIRDTVPTEPAFPITDSVAMEAKVNKHHEFSYIGPTAPAKIQAIALQYTPQELFIEVLRRSGNIVNDTIIPPVYRPYYSTKSLLEINQKNQPLRVLSPTDVASAYQYRSALEGLNVIYGPEDDREEVYYDENDLSNVPVRREMASARCVAALIPMTMLKPNSAGTAYTLSGYMTFALRFRLCSRENFREQPAPADCTAFLLKDSTLVTAGHCFDGINYTRYYYVFDFFNDAQQQPRLSYPARNVYKAIDMIAPTDGTDARIIKLNRGVDLRRIPEFSDVSGAETTAMYYVTGCPGGVPLKLAASAPMLNNFGDDAFLIGSDTYKCNSGSPVFNVQTHKIEGMLIEGANDFRNTLEVTPCRISFTCPQYDCQQAKGEKVLKNKKFLHLLN